jgi:hypothetical protein
VERNFFVCKFTGGIFMTLLEETLEALKAHGLSEKDVLWCGTSGQYYPHCYFTWEDFKEVAQVDTEGKRVADDLIIVGRNWWLERYTYIEYKDAEYHKYDQDCWVFHCMPLKPLDYLKPEKLVGDGDREHYCIFTELNKDITRDLTRWQMLSKYSKEKILEYLDKYPEYKEAWEEYQRKHTPELT